MTALAGGRKLKTWGTWLPRALGNSAYIAVAGLALRLAVALSDPDGVGTRREQLVAGLVNGLLWAAGGALISFPVFAVLAHHRQAARADSAPLPVRAGLVGAALIGLITYLVTIKVMTTPSSAETNALALFFALPAAAGGAIVAGVVVFVLAYLGRSEPR